MMGFGYNGLCGLLILAGDVWAIINIGQSAVSNGKKLVWIVAVLVLPLVGLILWYFLGPRGKAGAVVSRCYDVCSFDERRRP